MRWLALLLALLPCAAVAQTNVAPITQTPAIGAAPSNGGTMVPQSLPPIFLTSVVSSGAPTCTYSLNFSQACNSQYLVVIK